MENYWQTKEEELKHAEEAVTVGVPPPPQEVKIRTFQSDLESIRKTGGSMPRFEEVKVPQLEVVAKKEREEKKSGILSKAIIVVIAIAALAGAIYFFYGIFAGPGEQPATQSSSNSGGPTAAVPSVPRAPDFVHYSLFTRLADEVLTFVSKPKAESAAELKTFSQRMQELLATAGKNANFIEVLVQDADGRPLAAHEVLALSDSEMLPAEFMLEKFNPDPTFFVYRDANGDFWPGIIMALKPSENWLFLRDEISRLEQSSRVENFFLKYPGPRSGRFVDAVLSDQPARKLSFATGADFLYGWFRGNLILSASEEGLKEVLGRL